MTDKRSLLPRIEKKYEADIFYYEGPLTCDGARHLRNSIDATAMKYADVLLILDTTEGFVEAAWQMINALKGPYGYHGLTLYVPELCTGPGALLAIAADTIIMGDAGRIGQICGSLNSKVLSAKNVISGFKVLKSELGDSELAAAAIGNLDLQAVGRQERDMQLAREYIDWFAPVEFPELVENLMGKCQGPNPLFGWADLATWTKVIQPSDALVDLAYRMRADTMKSGLPAPHARFLGSGRRAPTPKRQRAGASKPSQAKAA